MMSYATFYTMISISFIIGWLLVILLVVAIFVNRKYLCHYFKQIDKRVWVILLIIILLALLLRIYIPPKQHIIFFDAQEYMGSGRDMLLGEDFYYYLKAPAWSAILMAAFGLFGLKYSVAFAVNMVIGALSATVIFLLAYAVTKNAWLSIVPAFLISLLPIHIRYSASTQNDVVGVFFMMLTALFFFLYYEKRALTLLLLALLSATVATLIRPENFLSFFIFSIWLFAIPVKKRISTRILLPIFILVLLLLTINAILQGQVYLQSPEMDTLSGMNKGRGIFEFANNFIFSSFIPVLAIVYAIIGIGYCAKRKPKVAVVFFAWMLTMLGFAALEYATDPTYYDRFYLGVYPSLLIFCMFGLLAIYEYAKKISHNYAKLISITAIAILVIPFVFMPQKAAAIHNSEEFRLMTEIPEMASQDIPKDCLIVASSSPRIFNALKNYSTSSAGPFLNDDIYRKSVMNQYQCVLFFEGIECGPFWNDPLMYCKQMRDKFEMKKYISYKLGNTEYTFYQILGVKNITEISGE